MDFIFCNDNRRIYTTILGDAMNDRYAFILVAAVVLILGFLGIKELVSISTDVRSIHLLLEDIRGMMYTTREYDFCI